MWVQSLGWEIPLEDGVTTCTSTLTGKIPWTEEPDRVQSTRSQRVKHDLATKPALPFLQMKKLRLKENELQACVLRVINKVERNSKAG